MGTANQIITDALKKLGVWQKGETIDADEGADGLRALNLMIDSWSNEDLMLYQQVQRTKALTSSDGQYTIGDSGDIDTTRPVRIATAYVQDSGGNDWPIKIINAAQWASISLKTVDGTYPSYLYYRPDYPLGVINLYPEPSSGLTLYLECWDQITQFASGVTSASLPPGYERALIYNLAIELAPEYGKPIGQEIAKLAMESREFIQDVNNTEIPTLVSSIASPHWNKWIGEYE